MPTIPFDEATYPRLRFTRQQLDVIALAREIHPQRLNDERRMMNSAFIVHHSSLPCRRPDDIQTRFRPRGVVP